MLSCPVCQTGDYCDLSVQFFLEPVPSLAEKFRCVHFERDSFCGDKNTINLIMYNDKVVIPDKIQKYVVKWYHT